MTSLYLSLPRRSIEEVLEARDEANSGSRTGDADTEAMDALQELRDAAKALHDKFMARIKVVDVAFEAACLEDIMSDLEGRRQEIEDQRRNWC